MTVSPLAMPARRTVKTVRMTMAAQHARCQDGANCKGPGCRVSTGKTADKRRPVGERLGYGS